MKAKAEREVMGPPQVLTQPEAASVERTFINANGNLPKCKILTIIERIELEMSGGELTAPRVCELPSEEEVEAATKA